MAAKEKIYALYKGDNFLGTGTAQELANLIGVTRRTIQWYSYPTYQKRSKNPKNRLIAIKIDEE